MTPLWRSQEMRCGYLSEYFEGVAVKKLSRVDATPQSNQHEIGTTRAMRRFLGEEKKTFAVVYLWLGSEQESFSEEGTATLYDTREQQEHRGPEWRLYYPSNPVTDVMTEGETLFLAKRTDGTLLFVVAPAGSTIQNQLLWLFGFETQPELGFDAHQIEGSEDAELDFAARLILDELGIEFEDPRANTLDSIIERFGGAFPKTREFSDLARLTLPHVSAVDDPDSALIAWLNHEEALFRRLERRIVAARLASGFGPEPNVDVEGFIHFSLQVQNRRKSRMGRAFENHLEAVFRAHELTFETQVVTEQRNTADFLFPGSAEYHDQSYPTDRLTMLAAKSTCKERWRQVLPEARRIWPKHLITLEPAISVAQTDQMKDERVVLVVPRPIQDSYKPEQRDALWSVNDVIELVRMRTAAPAEKLTEFLKSIDLRGLNLTREKNAGRHSDI
ncbi:type II restriction endonuclease [Sphingomonas sp. LY54]|uniref:type II restriction endonuclease n=1 Tax=Sphingomonas sp. LY54 TaxID=3095343 RepID=UPI002D76CF86|nr:type II restriction endonuclease [Sphingomonas sp. LY54]WRP29419.1 type II restriction endonuclease [Sphingomonas sp. LY54]